MSSDEFLSLHATAELSLAAAKTAAERQYWVGYLKGIRRWRMGLEHWSENDHARWLSPEGPRSEGYRAGLQGRGCVSPPPG